MMSIRTIAIAALVLGFTVPTSAQQSAEEQAFLEQYQRMQTLYQEFTGAENRQLKAQLQADAIESADATLALAEGVVDPDSEAMAVIRATAAAIYLQGGTSRNHFQRATDLLESSIDQLEALYGDGTTHVIQLYRMRGNARNRMIDPFNTSPLRDDYSKALKISEKNFGEHSIEFADLNREISNFFSAYPYYLSDAERYLKDALEAYRAIDNREALRRGIVAFNLGKVERGDGHAKSSLEYLNEALELALEDPDGASAIPGFTETIRAFLVQSYADIGDEEMATFHSMEIARVDPLDMSTRTPNPIYTVQPDFPMAAAEQGLSGYVVVRFTIGTDGRVKYPIVEESTSSLFESSALEAVQKLRYTPRLIDGMPVDTPDRLYKYTYQLVR